MHRRHFLASTALALLPWPRRSAAGAAARSPRLRPFPLSQVRLLPGPALDAAEVNRRFVLGQPPGDAGMARVLEREYGGKTTGGEPRDLVPLYQILDDCSCKHHEHSPVETRRRVRPRAISRRACATGAVPAPARG